MKEIEWLLASGLITAGWRISLETVWSRQASLRDFTANPAMFDRSDFLVDYEKRYVSEIVSLEKMIYLPVDWRDVDIIISDWWEVLRGILRFPVILLWDIIVITAAVWLEIVWIGFLFGSVVGVVLVLLFDPSLFALPLGLVIFLSNPWPKRELSPFELSPFRARLQRAMERDRNKKLHARTSEEEEQVATEPTPMKEVRRCETASDYGRTLKGEVGMIITVLAILGLCLVILVAIGG